MKVPEEIRKVPRPRNTIVEDNGSDGMCRFSVRERGKVICEPGKNPKPRNGKVIGHIINYKFVPAGQAKLAASGPESLSFGSSALVHSVSADLLEDLLAVFPAKEAYQILAIASLRAINPGIAANRYSTEYHRTFISVFYPNLPMSKNTISTLLKKLGIDQDKRDRFIARRFQSICENDHIAIDGTVKQDTSSVNSFSAFSYKGRVRGVREVSVIYAYSIERKEPICAEVFPGNCLDVAAFRKFITHNKLHQGLIFADKGFSVSQIKKDLKEHPKLHYLTPVELDDEQIREHALTDFDDGFLYGDKKVFCKKVKLDNGKFLYSFQDIYREFIEKTSYLVKSAAKNGLDVTDFQKRKDRFGVIVFESDQDLSSYEIYRCYSERWELEVVFDMYKHDEELNDTAVQDEFAIRGYEFIDLIAAIITARCVRKADEAGILKNITYTNLLSDLGQVWRDVKAPRKAKRDDNYWVHEFEEALDLMTKLGLCEPGLELVVPKKTGRPKVTSSKPKRPVGRPRIHPKPDPDAPRRGRGRPRIHPKPDLNAPKRPRGRPRKNQGILTTPLTPEA